MLQINTLKATRNIKAKAFLLMVVFSMNTVIGFACSVGVKMGYNNHHHPATAIANQSLHHHHSNKEHKHSQPAEGKDDCCSHGITVFNLLDKVVTANPATILHPVAATMYLGSFYTQWTLPKLFTPKDIRAFAQSYHPPIPDIRVAIQSFQI